MSKFKEIKTTILKIVRTQSNHFDEAKKKFSESFEVNPIYATEWHLKAVVKAQTVHTIWFPINSIVKNATTIKEILFGVEQYYKDIKRGAIDNVRLNSSSSQITNVKRAWEIEQTFDCIREEFGSGLNNLCGLVKWLKKEIEEI